MIAPPIRPLPKTLLNKNFILLWQGQLVSRIGTEIFTIATILWLKSITDSGTLLGLLSVAQILPALALAALGGVVADRISRKKIVVLGDIISGLFVGAFAALVFFFAEAELAAIILLFAVMTVLSTIEAVFTPAVAAAIPDLVPKRSLERANAANTAVISISLFLGQGFGGLFYVLIGGPLLFLINAGSFFFSAISEAFVTIPPVEREKIEQSESTAHVVLRDAAEGFRFIGANRGMLATFILIGALNFFIAPFVVLIPFHVEDILNVNPAWFGYLLMGYGGALLLGSLLAGAIKPTPKQRVALTVIALIAQTAPLAVAGYIPSIYPIFIAYIFVGFTDGLIDTWIMTAMQVATPTEFRGRVFGVSQTIMGAFFPLGMLLAGILADVTNKNIPMIYLCAGVLTFLVSVVMVFNPAFRRFMAYDAAAEDEDTLPED